MIKTGITTRELGIQEGLEQGEERERRRVVQRQLTRKFGPLSPAVQERLDALSMERLDVLTEELLDATSLAQLGLDGE